MNRKNLIVLLIVFIIAMFISACGSSFKQNGAGSSNKDKVTDEKNKFDDESNKDDDNKDKNNSSNNHEGIIR